MTSDCLVFAFLKADKRACAPTTSFQNNRDSLDVGHSSFCDSIIRCAMLATPIIVKIPGTIFTQILVIHCIHPKSTNIDNRAIMPTTTAIKQVTIDLIFLGSPFQVHY